MSSSTPEILRLRASVFARVREFFATRNVLEVDTPLLGHGLVVEAHLEPIPCRVQLGTGGKRRERHLLTSPEGPMKRLLAEGSGPIYQIAHAFRDGESGRRHSPEFTILEWYRPGYDHHELMEEVAALFRAIIPGTGDRPFEKRTYRDLFVDGAGIDPFETSIEEVHAACERLGVPLPAEQGSATIDDALDLLLVGHLEPTLGTPDPVFIHDYPASQAALARTRTDGDAPPVGERFELYARGLELANGYHELADPVEQRRRFEAANQCRVESGRPPLPIDEELIEALGNRFPPCAGVALGLDRLMMVARETAEIDDVRRFPLE